MSKKNSTENFPKPNYNRVEINNVIREISEIFSRLRCQSLEITKIERVLQKYNVSRSELRENLSNNSRFTFDGQRIYRRKKFDISNETDLLELLKGQKNGVEENQDLYDCYMSCKRDIEDMKKKGNLRVVENKAENKKYLFLKNEKYQSKEFDDVIEKMKRKWSEVIENEYSMKTREIEIKNKARIDRKARRKRKIRKIHNYWMKGIIDFRDINNTEY